MEIKRRTPRVQLVQTSIMRKMADLTDDLQGEIQIDEDVLDLGLSRFAELSARWLPNGTALDFQLASGMDSAEQIREKFLAYLDTESVDEVEAAFGAMYELDRPADPATAPLPPPEDDAGN